MRNRALSGNVGPGGVGACIAVTVPVLRVARRIGAEYDRFLSPVTINQAARFRTVHAYWAA